MRSMFFLTMARVVWWFTSRNGDFPQLCQILRDQRVWFEVQPTTAGNDRDPGTDASEGRWARCQDSCFTEQLPGYRSCHQDYPNSWAVFKSPFDSWLYDIRKGWFHEWEYPNSWMVRMVFVMENPSINGWLGVPLFQETSIWGFTIH